MIENQPNQPHSAEDEVLKKIAGFQFFFRSAFTEEQAAHFPDKSKKQYEAEKQEYNEIVASSRANGLDMEYIADGEEKLKKYYEHLIKIQADMPTATFDAPSSSFDDLSDDGVK